MFHVYKIQRDDGLFYGKKPRFYKGRYYFGKSGKIFSRKIDAIVIAEDIRKHENIDIIEYDVTFGRIVE